MNGTAWFGETVAILGIGGGIVGATLLALELWGIWRRRK